MKKEELNELICQETQMRIELENSLEKFSSERI
jgi:hypothetical protein